MRQLPTEFILHAVFSASAEDTAVLQNFQPDFSYISIIRVAVKSGASQHAKGYKGNL